MKSLLNVFMWGTFQRRAVSYKPRRLYTIFDFNVRIPHSYLATVITSAAIHIF